MRFLLLILGFLLLAIGIYYIAYGASGSHQISVLLVQVGAIFFATGAVAVDIVEAINRRGS